MVMKARPTKRLFSSFDLVGILTEFHILESLPQEFEDAAEP